MSTPAIVVDDVSKKFRIYHERNQTLKTAVMRRRRSVHEDFWALREVALEIPPSSTFALIGDNGSGKSTLLKCMAKILYPNSGSITANGRLAALLEVGSGFHPELSGRENIYLNGSILGMRRPEIDRKFDEIVSFSGVEEFIDQPVKYYSSGMYVRLGFSVAIHIDPEILLVDEVLAVGDASFQEKCAEKFAQFRRDGRTVVVVSHALPQLRQMADHAAWLEHGRLKEVGEAKDVIQRYLDSTRSDVRTDADGRVRWGSGEAVVERVEVLGADGYPADEVIPTGATVVLRVHYQATERIVRPLFGLSVETHDGTFVWGNSSKDNGFSVDHIDGAGALDLTIPAIPLAAGGFVVHAAVSDWDSTHVFDYVRDIARLNIGHGNPVESGGIVTMGGTWSDPAQDRGMASPQ